jgi:hypothetical protein
VQPEEKYLGGVASYFIETSMVAGFKPGYGLYVTNKRIIGISYGRPSLLVDLIPYVLFLSWIGSLVVALIIARQTGSSEIPAGPYIMALLPLTLVFALVISPRWGERIIGKRSPTSLEALDQSRKNLEISREQISEVRCSVGGVSVNLQSGAKLTFYIKRRKLAYQVAQIMETFCLAGTPIPLKVMKGTPLQIG